VVVRVDVSLLASELRVVLGQLVRRLRTEHRFPLTHGAVLGRLDREGARSTVDLAVAERVRPQSMGQTLAELEAEGLIGAAPCSSSPMPGAGRSSRIAAGARGGWPARSRGASRPRSSRCSPKE
jgi:hypothetical protein